MCIRDRYKDEARAFSMFASLIDRMGLCDLLRKKVPQLRSYLYQLSRLVALYLPAVHTHLAEEGVAAVHFASPWFLTYFTYVTQYCKDTPFPPLLLAILDKFFIVKVLDECRTEARLCCAQRFLSCPTLRKSCCHFPTKDSSCSSAKSRVQVFTLAIRYWTNIGRK
eukprot:TRINITY_DN5801_c0_g1_i5.p1 TRINITY_DN5801_c0_g1~~TRINITY_DN5801_c0_g1_i5.p1  ORF type:complete len:166 (-),score=18.55 TRINITY_DN5801_c0_g1_i5:284-781(-)